MTDESEPDRSSGSVEFRDFFHFAPFADVDLIRERRDDRLESLFFNRSLATFILLFLMRINI